MFLKTLINYKVNCRRVDKDNAPVMNTGILKVAVNSAKNKNS
jgi:hypothetical protein